jgi:hypothetical protein
MVLLPENNVLIGAHSSITPKSRIPLQAARNLIGSPRILICAAFESALDVGQWVTGRRSVGSFQGSCRVRTPS